MVRCLLIVTVLANAGCGGTVSSDVTAEHAIRGTPDEQEKAAVLLTRGDRSAIPLLRKVAKESSAPRARAVAIQALGAFNDLESAPMLLAALDDADPQVRGRAGVAMSNILGADFQFRPDDPAPKRAAVAAYMRRSYELMLKNGAFRR